MTDVIILHGACRQPAHDDHLAGLPRSRGVRMAVPDLYELSLDEGTAPVEDGPSPFPSRTAALADLITRQRRGADG